MALKSELPVLPVVVLQEGIDDQGTKRDVSIRYAPRHCSHVLQHSKPFEQSPRESRGGMHTIHRMHEPGISMWIALEMKNEPHSVQ